MEDIAVKFLEAGSRGPYSGHVFDPSSDAWLPDQPVRECKSGYHYTTIGNLIEWVRSEAYEIEARGAVDFCNKSAATSIRFVRRLNCNDRILRLFAADCAEACLPLFERERPGDNRPRRAIEATRMFAAGRATTYELKAARDAAGAAAGNAARDAAGAAAGNAARDAAGAAARDAARDAAWDAARTAARDAAGDATWDATWDAARDAAWDAAWDAAGDAAGDAANHLLLAYLLDDDDARSNAMEWLCSLYRKGDN